MTVAPGTDSFPPMTEPSSDPPRKSPAELRRERLAAALRQNLRRRKEQARARRDPAGPGDADGGETPPDGAD